MVAVPAPVPVQVIACWLPICQSSPPFGDVTTGGSGGALGRANALRQTLASLNPEIDVRSLQLVPFVLT